MKILVTGATGFVGRHLVKRLLQLGHDVVLLVRHSSHYEDLGIDHVVYFDGNDGKEVDYLTASFKEEHFDGIIHLASLYIAQHKPEQIKDLVLSNIYLGSALLEAAKVVGVKWFLNTGSIWQNYEAENYSDAYNPVNLYAATKQAFMVMAKYYTETSKLRFCTLKLCDTYGPDDTRRKIFALFEQIAKTGECLKMSPGEQKLDIVHIDDVIQGFVSLAEMLNEEQSLLDEYVLSCGTQMSLKEWAKHYAERKGVSLNIEWGGRPYRAREVMAPYVGNVLPNWKPLKTIEDIMVVNDV